MSTDLLVITSARPTARQSQAGGAYWRFDQLLRVLAKDVGLDWSKVTYKRMPVLPKGPRNYKSYTHQGKDKPHDEILEQRNHLFKDILTYYPRLILTLGGPAANIVVRGCMNRPPRMNLAEDRYGVWWAPLRWAKWTDHERKRAGNRVIIREYEDEVDPGQLYPVMCTWSPGEVSMQPRLRDYYCEDIERALTWLKETP